VSGLTDGHYDVTTISPTTFQVDGGFAAATYDNDVGSGIIGQVRFPDADDCGTGTVCGGKKGRGDYLLAEWAMNFRDYTERDGYISRYNDLSGACNSCMTAPGSAIRTSQESLGMPRYVSSVDVSEHSIPFIVCIPQVMCISPNGEVWENGTTFDFDTLTLDATYGALWSKQFVQVMPDTFWQKPHTPCVSCVIDAVDTKAPTDCGWHEDNGACPNDDLDCNCSGDDGYIPGIRYYAQRPWVEARITTPGGCSDLPAGMYLNYLTIEDLNSLVATGRVLQPPDYPTPSLPGCPVFDQVLWPYMILTPWGLWIAEAACVCDDMSTHRFSDEYLADGINAC
jgi:hypothetical protein